VAFQGSRTISKKTQNVKGTVVELYIALDPAAPMRAIQAAHTVPGRGIEGDRYFTGCGTFSEPPAPDSDITLVEAEMVEAFNGEHGMALSPADTRRNIVTRGIRLNDLQAREFTIGNVRLLGHGLCEPCAHLQKLTDQRVLTGLLGRGGLRAQVLQEGTILVGDVIAY
jgi:MOSC domain-containing protein YiiM